MEDYERLAEWIREEIEKLDQKELLARKDPRRHVKLSVREIERRMGISHPQLVRAMKGQGHHNVVLLKQLAAFFGAPEEAVLRVAGVLPDINQDDIELLRILAAAESLKTQTARTWAEQFIRWLREQEDKEEIKEQRKKNTPFPVM